MRFESNYKHLVSTALRFSSASFLVANPDLSLQGNEPVVPFESEEQSIEMVQLVPNKQYRVIVPNLANSGIVIPEPRIIGESEAPSEPEPEPVPEHFPQGKVIDEGEESIWKVLRDCETGDNIIGAPFYVEWTYSGPGFYDGAYQFDPTTWSSLSSSSGYDFAWQAPPSVQTAAAVELQGMYGWGQWPACTAKMRSLGYIQ